MRSDFHNSKHTYRATERERKRESARRGREMGVNGLPLSVSSSASPDVDGHTSKEREGRGGGHNKQSMRNEGGERVRERARRSKG